MMNKKIKITLIVSTVIVFVFSMSLYTVQNAELKEKYDAAKACEEKGDIQGALDIVSIIGEYRDSESLVEEYTDYLRYEDAVEHIDNKEYQQALELLEVLNAEGGGYKDSAQLQDSVEYARAVQLAEEGKLSEAYERFKMLPGSYSDVSERILELGYAMKFVDKWFCKEHSIDMDITARVDSENITHLHVEMKDRNGFLLNAESNKLVGEDLILMEDRFVWNLLGGETRYAIIMEDNKLKVAKQPVTDNEFIVTFVRKLSSYNPVDGDINAAINRDVDGGL